MALIRIERNEAGNCINFHGATNPSYWNTCLHAEVDSVDTDRINIINDIRTTDTANPVYEFYKIPFVEFVDADGSAFSTAAECADYITTNANVLGGSGGKLFDPNDRIGFSRDFTDTTILITNGDAFGVNSIQAVADGEGTITIQEHGSSSDISKIYREVNHSHVSINGSLVGGSLANVVNQLNALFTVSPLGAGGQQGPTVFQVSSTANITTSSIGTDDPSGTPIFEDDGLVGHGVVASTEFISEKGEYFQFTMTGRGRFLFGLYESGVDSIVSGTNLQTNKLWAQGMYDHGDYVAPDAAYGRDNSTSQEDGWAGASGVQFRYNTGLQADLSSGNPVAFRVGITSEGYIASYYYDDGRSNNWVMIGRSSYYAGEGNYGLHITLVGEGAQVYATPTISHVDTTLPEVTVYYIESPDGSFHFPLYETETQADAADIVAGGSGSSVANIYVDEPTNTTWYMPVSGSFTDFSAAPTNTSAVTYTEIPTNADNLYGPASLTINNLTVDEGASVNYQIIPQDTVATVAGLPAGLSYSNGYVQGTAPQVSGYISTNPSDTYTVSATRANNYASTTDTFDITVTNLTQQPNAISGFTHVSGTALVDTSTLDDGSIVALDETLNSGKRIYVLQAWVETHILPNLTESNDTIYLGVSGSSAVLGTAEDADFDAFIKWQYRSATQHTSVINSGGNANTVVVNSATDAFYDYAFESDGSGLHVIACNVNTINTEPGVENGGSFSRTVSSANTGDPFTLLFATNGTTMTVANNTDVAEIDIPLGTYGISVVETSESAATFDGSAVSALTLNAGYTYRFMLNDASIESGDTLTFETIDGTSYTSGVSTVGSHGDYLYYVQFAVPSDAPPLQVKWNSTVQGAPNISGSTYVASVSGITLEGPAIHQTGTNLFDSSDHGWASIDTQLSAGNTLVMNTAFLADLVDAMPDSTQVKIGLKDGAWASTTADTNFEGSVRFVIDRTSSTDVDLRTWAGNTTTTLISTTVAGITSDNISAGLAVTNSGNNIRFVIRTDSTNNSDDVSSVTYGDWDTNYKVQTGDQGYGLSTVDVMFLGRDLVTGAGMDTADVDWTALFQIANPAAAATLTTSWTKALDFGGGGERAKQVGSGNSVAPLRMGGVNNNAAAPTTAGYTSNDTNARPWATAIVFNIDGNASNQHIWNHGEGANVTNDNIYLRVDASRNLYFGWGRSGEINECKIMPSGVGSLWTLTAGWWYGVYIASNGTRLGGTYTASQIADAFDIRLMGSSDSFSNLSPNLSVSPQSNGAGWNSSGYRMNRQFAGDFTIGGRGSNRNFQGKVASTVVTTLRRNVAMPTDAEISMMIRDPEQWLTDYKVGDPYRPPASSSDSISNWALNNTDSSYATQVWLMGDGTSDAYAKIRNQSFASTQNDTPLDMISMVSNDIETVNISGLT